MITLILFTGIFAGTAAMLAAKCLELGAELQYKREIIRKQTDDISAQKVRISDLNGMVAEKDVQIKELKEQCSVAHNIRKIVL